MLKKLWQQIMKFCEAENINCPSCNNPAFYSHAWGRQSVYKCASCNKDIKIKTLD